MPYEEAADYAERHALHALVIRRGAHVVREEYGAGWERSRPHALYSGTKSFWGIAAIAAEEDGLLRLDEPVARTIVEWTDALRSTMTIRHLLALTSGYGFGGLGTAVPTAARAIATELKDAPGTTFTYGGIPLQVFGEVLRRKLVPHGQTPRAYLEARVLRPIGMRVASWRTLKDGTHPFPTGAFVAAEEWMRFGAFVRDDMQRFAPCFTGSAANPRYGLGFWLDPLEAGPAVVYASGAGGQALYVIPSLDLVALHFGGSPSFRHATFVRRLLAGSNG